MTSRSPRVVDFSTHLSGPLASHLLTEIGADVIKVENPRTGDGNRGLAPIIGGEGLFHVALNSGARSLAIDRRSPHWDSVVAACARWADAVIVGARPSDARHRGLDFATLVKANPRLVYCLISGYGPRGPWEDRPGHGQNIDAHAGLLVPEWKAGMPATPAGWRSTGTTLAGVHAAMGILAGLHRRSIGGGPQHVSVSIWHSALWWLWRDITASLNLGTSWSDYQDLGSRYRMYPTADDRAILLVPAEKKFWESFCDIIGLEHRKGIGDWSTSGMCFGVPGENDLETTLISERLRTRPADEWIPLFEAAEIPFAPILTYDEAVTSEHARANNVVVRTGQDGRAIELIASPVSLGDHPDDEPDRRLAPAPELGEHTAACLEEIGLADLVGEL